LLQFLVVRRLNGRFVYVYSRHISDPVDIGSCQVVSVGTLAAAYS